MVKVRVKYFGELHDLLGIREEEYDVEDATVAELLLKYIPNRHATVADRWRETVFATVRGEVAINKDGMPILRNHFILVGGKSTELNYRLKDGDEIAILPPVGGGNIK